MGKRATRGQSLIEFALVVPLLFLLVVNVVNFGGLFYSWIAVSHATRSAAQLLITGPAYAGYGSTYGLQAIATPTQIQNVLTDCSNRDANNLPMGDLCALPNRSTITVSVCSNDQSSGTATAQAPETCLPPTNPATGAVFADPEPNTSVVGTVEVSYRYCPFMPFWEFPALGVRATLPACTSSGTAGGVLLRRAAVMRMIQ